MRDYFIVGLVLACLPVGFLRPYFGMLVYTWLSYMYPYTYAWGFALTFPMAKLTALTTIAGTAFTGKPDFEPLRQGAVVLMLLLWGMFTVSTVFAFYPADAWLQWQDTSKLFLMALVTAVLTTEHRRLRYFLIVIALSVGFYGFKGGIFSILTGGQLMVFGPDSSILYANNGLGLALNMCLPMLWYLAQDERGILKRILQATFFLSMPAIMFTYSRASALTLPIVLIPILIRSRTGKVFLFSGLFLGAIFALPYVPERWWERQETVLTYETDGSAMSRIDNWKFCWEVAIDNPLTGGGFMMHQEATFAKYAPEFLDRYGGRTWNSHSIYFAMLGTHGFPGLILFMAMISACFFSCWRMQRDVRGHPELKWIESYCRMIQVSLLALLVNGTFVNMEYYDLVYHWVAVVASLKVICKRSLVQAEATEVVFDGRLATAHT